MTRPTGINHPVPQPGYDPERARMAYPDDAYRFMLTLTDEERSPPPRA